MHTLLMVSFFETFVRSASFQAFALAAVHTLSGTITLPI
jgi:hypothetical protein